MNSFLAFIYNSLALIDTTLFQDPEQYRLFINEEVKNHHLKSDTVMRRDYMGGDTPRVYTVEQIFGGSNKESEQR